MNSLEQEHLSTLSASRVCLEWVLSVLISSRINTSFPQRGPPSVLDSFGINGSFCVLSLPETSAMETSASRAGEKKDKMDGNGFSDLPKKPSPSETRGNALFKTFSQAATGSEFRVRLSVGPLHAVWQNEPTSRRCSARGQRGSEHGRWNIHFKDKVPSWEPMLVALLGPDKVPAAVRGDLQ